MAESWVFGYGSLVSPASLGSTLGRPVDVSGDGWSEATLVEWARRWNYGVGAFGWCHDVDGSVRSYRIVALGMVAAAHETVNGIVVRVSDDELARLDRRERFYDRVDVTDQIAAAGRVAGPVVTYVPRTLAIERYEVARDAGAAAIEQRYWDLVHAAFAALGADRLQRYRSSTPEPDVPVLALRR